MSTTEIYSILVETTGATRETTNLLRAQAALNNSLVRTQREARLAAESLDDIGRATRGTNIAAFGQQFSQIGQQVAAGSSAVQAFSVQIADIVALMGLSGFAGVAATVAGIALPQIIQAFIASKDAAESMADATDKARESISLLNERMGYISSVQENYRQAILDGNTALAETIRLQAIANRSLASLEILEATQALRERAETIAQLNEELVSANEAVAFRQAEADRYRSLGADYAFDLETTLIALENEREIRTDIETQLERAVLEQANLQAEAALAAQELQIAQEAIADIADYGGTASANMESFAGALERSGSLAAPLVGQIAALARAAAQAAAAANAAQITSNSVRLGGVRPSAEDVIGTQEQRSAIIEAQQAIRSYNRAQIEAAGAASAAGGASQDLTAARERERAATEAVRGILDEYNASLKKSTEIAELFTNSIGSEFDALIDRTKGVKEAFQDMLVGIANDVAKFLVSRQILSLTNLLAGAFGGSSFGDIFNTPIAGATRALTDGRADISLLTNPDLIPASAARSAPLPVLNTPSYAGPTKVVIENNTGVPFSGEVQSNGQELRILLTRELQQMMSSGQMDKTLALNYGIRRKSP